MSEFKIQETPFERIFNNLSILSERNPDFGRLLGVLDVWLENFVSSGSEFKSDLNSGRNTESAFSAKNSEKANPKKETEKSDFSQKSDFGAMKNVHADFAPVSAKKEAGIRFSPRTSSPQTETSAGTGTEMPAGSPAGSSVRNSLEISTSGNSAGNFSSGTINGAGASGSETCTGRDAHAFTSDFGTINSADAKTASESVVSYHPVAESLTADISPAEVAASAAAAAAAVSASGTAAGTGAISPASSGTAGGNSNSFRPEDIEQLEKRLLLKIEASRWALERDRLLKSTVDFQAEIEPRDHALLARARELTNCYLWMNNPETAPVIASDTYELLADAYAAAAKCVGFMRMLIDLVDRTPKSDILSRILRDALYITATAQSALRRVTYEVSGREDQDQIRIHRWLTLLTKRYSIYVNRHMKKDSLAPVDRIYMIPEFIERLKQEIAKLGQKQKILTEGFRRIQYHATRINANPESSADWQRIIETVDDLVDAGTHANDARFADVLKPVLNSLKEVPSYKEHPFFISVLMELDYWHENTPERALVEQELSEMPPRPSSQTEGEITDEYSSVWDEMERADTFGTDSAQADTRDTEVVNPHANTLSAANQDSEQNSGVLKFSPGKKTPSGFGAGILSDKNSDSAVNSDVERVFSVSANSTDSGHTHAETSTYSRITAPHGIPSYAGVVSRAHANAHHFAASTSNPVLNENASDSGTASGTSSGSDSGSSFSSGSASGTASGAASGAASMTGAEKSAEFAASASSADSSRMTSSSSSPVAAVSAANSEETLEEARKALSGKTIVLIDDENHASLREMLSDSLKTTVALVDAQQMVSMARLAQTAHPESVALVLLVEGMIPASNRNLETYCRNFDKPLLRVRRDSEMISIARQIIAALTLWH